MAKGKKNNSGTSTMGRGGGRARGRGRGGRGRGQGSYGGGKKSPGVLKALEKAEKKYSKKKAANPNLAKA